MARTVEQILREQLGGLMFQNANFVSQLEIQKEKLDAALKELGELKERGNV